jgi:hypothetical protein
MKRRNLYPSSDGAKPASTDKRLKDRKPPHVEDPVDLGDERDLQVAHLIRQMPDLEPPPHLLSSVMQSIQPKTLPWWVRMYRWAISPKSITFTPLRVVPVALLLIVAFAALSLFTTLPHIGNQPFQRHGQHQVPVVFNLRLPDARSVSVIGSFNAWKAQGYEMRLDEQQKAWSLMVSLPEGRHEYAFLVDGQKVIPDPGASFFQQDGFGNKNSVLILRAKNGQET